MAKRVGYLCSNPDCRCSTVGAAPGHDGVVNVGVAAHITAAAPNGPRYDATLRSEQRRHHTNGIWMCQTHGKLVDSDAKHFTVEMLRIWKRDAEQRAFQAIVAPAGRREHDMATATIDAAIQLLIDRLGLPAQDDVETVATRLIAAARDDLATFRRMAGWPRHPVPLNLRMTDAGNERAFQVSGLAAALNAFNEISMIAPPGTGKTTTLLQVADAVVEAGDSAPIFVPLGEWASQTGSLLQIVLQRAAYQGIREQHLMLLGYHGRIILLLDGWNELDRDARRRATAEIKRLRRDFPALGIVISTRRQALDVPIAGPVVEIDILTEAQQAEIATALGGAQGESLLDRALRTPGVRDLIAVPLYLTALLTHAPDGNMPTTREAVLRLFVTEHERGADRAEALHGMLFGFHGEVLTALAVEATGTANTAISDSRARAVVREAEKRLTEAGQIAEAPQPAAVLDLFVAHHTLVRSCTAPAPLSFQHQQFQEWYASFEVERAMRVAALGDPDAMHRLRADILDRPAWEESVLFACERASRDGQSGIEAVAGAIITALTIDPMLAAEMIYRSDAAVWERVCHAVLGFIGRWHRPERVDRAARFMVASGRQEFCEQIWPLVANPDSQIHLSVMRASRRFRPSVLGAGSAARLAALAEGTRHHVLAELVMRAGPEGIDLATSVATSDPSAAVQFGVVEALFFRRAERKAIGLLAVAGAEVWRMLAAKGYAEDIIDPDTRERVNGERQRLLESTPSPAARIALVLASPNPSGADKLQISAAIEAAEFPPNDQNIAWQLQKAFERYPDIVAGALLRRLEAGRDVPYRAGEMLNAVDPVDDGPIAARLTDLGAANQRTLAEAGVVGPRTVEALMDELMRLADQIAAAPGRYNRAVSDRFLAVKHRIEVTRATSFIPALLAQGRTSEPHRIGVCADLLANHGPRESHSEAVAIAEDVRRAVIDLVHRWAETLLSSPNSKRRQLAEVARAIGRLGTTALVADLARLLAADLERWRAARERRRTSMATMSIEERSDAAHCWTLQYREAFAAIGGDQVVEIMHGYLENEDFGFDAGCVLKQSWDREQSAPAPDPLKSWPDFGDVAARRAQRSAATGPEVASAFAEMIFAAIECLTAAGTNEKQQRVGIALARLGLSMPHGDQRKVIATLLGLALPVRSKRELLAALVLDGEAISADLVLRGVHEWLDEAREKNWMYRDHLWEVEGLLQLLPFSDRPAATIEGVEPVMSALPHPEPLERVVSALGDAPGDEAERVLKELMRRCPRLASEHDWVRAIVKRGSDGAGVILMDLVGDSALTSRAGAADSFWIARELLALVQRHPDLRDELLRRYQSATENRARAAFEHAIAELGDAEAVLSLVRAYAARGRTFDGLLQRAIYEAALSKEPSAGWSGAYELHPVPLPQLRKALFAMLESTAATAALAENCLTAIDELRDEYGSSEFEPRHPDVESGRPWPRAAG